MGNLVTIYPKNVPSSAAMDTLAHDVGKLGTSVEETAKAVKDEWKVLSEVFKLDLTRTPAEMLNPIVKSVESYADVMEKAKRDICNAAMDVFKPLETRREELLADMQRINEQYTKQKAILDAEIATFLADPENAGTRITARNNPGTRAYNNANVRAGLLEDDADALRQRVDTFNADVESAEADLASKLRGYSGGDTVNGSNGKAFSTYSSTWGVGGDAYYPGGPRSPKTSLADALRRALANGVVDRINWLASADPAEVKEWMERHRNFLGSVTFVPPEMAARLYAGLDLNTEKHWSGNYLDGPLAQLLALAPGVIGNLNGLPSAVKDKFNVAQLAQLLDNDKLSGDQRKKLESLQDLLTQNGDLKLLSVFMDGDASPRASVAWGDVDNADQITTMTHGIATDLGSLGEWSTIAADTKAYLDRQIYRKYGGSGGPSTAVVLFMEWDSGNALTVQGADRPEAGANRMVQLVQGFSYVNPHAQQVGWAHSLGTTALGQAVELAPGLFDRTTFFGSAGITDEASNAMQSQIAAGDLRATATHAKGEDWIAPLGRTDWLSAHSNNPIESVGGIDEFSARGGTAPSFVNADGTAGAGHKTQGHNAGPSNEFIYTFNDFEFLWQDMNYESVGYLDPRSQTFLEAVGHLADDAIGHGQKKH